MRTGTFQTVKEGCLQILPLICLARYLSDRPIVWCFFCVGYKILHSSTTLLLGSTYADREGVGVTHGQNNTVNCMTKKVDTGNAILPRRPSTCVIARGNNNNATSSENTPASITALSLTTLPSMVLSNVSCYLHPRDVLVLDTVLQSAIILQQQQRGDGGGQRGGDSDILHDIWKCLWYRDYGNVLLQWKIARQAFARSLMARAFIVESSVGIIGNKNAPDEDDGWVDEQLSKCLDEMTKVSSNSTTMKDFYFLFGECQIDYLLARKNTVEECYLGLHGHIFDFTDFAEYHPGLIEPIIKECGGDATFFFEDVPHSSGARNMVRRLCVLVNHNVIQYANDDSSRGLCCGLELVLENDMLERKRVLRLSNTRLPPMTYSSKNENNKRVDQGRNRWMPHIVPRRRQLRRHPTLEKVRTRFEQDQKKQQSIDRYESKNGHERSKRPDDSLLDRLTPEVVLPIFQFWKQRQHIQTPHSRIYYDPLLRKWIRWSTEISQ